MIPRKIHWIWLGTKPVPDDQRRWMNGWQDMHPEWQCRLWTDADRPRLVNERLFLRARNDVQRSDILRFELLQQFGGVYLDTDVECLRRLDPLLEVNNFAGEEQPGVLGSAVLGARQGSAWVDALVYEVPMARFLRLGQSHETGPMFITSVTSTRSDVTIFPSHFFYSKPWTKKQGDGPGEASGEGERFAIHHWYGSWAYSPPGVLERISYQGRQRVPRAIVRRWSRMRIQASSRSSSRRDF